MQKTAALLIIFLLLSVGYCPLIFAESKYKLGPGDSLEVSVWKDEYLTRQLIVPPDGIISYTLIGDIDVAELTVTSLRGIIKDKLKDYVNNPTVTVILLGANSLTASVVGKVNSPGQFPINMETSVMHILAMAGDLNPYASPSKILVLRQSKGKTIKIPFDYNEVKKGNKLEQNIFLQRGDVVVVP